MNTSIPFKMRKSIYFWKFPVRIPSSEELSAQSDRLLIATNESLSTNKLSEKRIQGTNKFFKILFHYVPLFNLFIFFKILVSPKKSYGGY